MDVQDQTTPKRATFFDCCEGNEVKTIGYWFFLYVIIFNLTKVVERTRLLNMTTSSSMFLETDYLYISLYICNFFG